MATSRRRRRKTKVKYNQKRLALTVVISCVLIFCVVFLARTISTLSYDKVYEGVSVNGISVSGMSEEELWELLPQMFDFAAAYDITIEADRAKEKINTLALEPAADAEKMVREIMACGRTKKGFARLGEISDLKKNPVDIAYMLSFDEKALQEVLDDISDTLHINAVDNKVVVGDDCVYVTRGVSGTGFVYEEVIAALSECILNGEDTVTLTLSEINPEEITVDFLKRHTYEEVLDATYTIADHKLIITESHPGVKFNEGEAKRAIKDGEGISDFTVPAKVKWPEVTEESLRESLLKDELGSYTTDFSSSSNNRAHNIKLACSKIDGYILAPGEEFSYNNVVGDRTVEAGYKEAGVYVGATVQEGIGGGICQVSSTLFNAAVYANLEITERRNHSLPVGYVDKGRDATVAYDSIDFKFKNTYSTPIEIRAVCEGRKNIISFHGIDDHPEREIEVITEQTATSEPKLVKKKDNTLPEGTVKVEQSGTKGSSHIAYKIVKENGKEVSREELCRSTYKGMDRIEIHGTKKPDEPKPADTPKPTATPKPAETPKPTATPDTSEDSDEE